jgi:hypothetical protein
VNQEVGGDQSTRAGESSATSDDAINDGPMLELSVCRRTQRSIAHGDDIDLVANLAKADRSDFENVEPLV